MNIFITGVSGFLGHFLQNYHTILMFMEFIEMIILLILKILKQTLKF